MDLLFQFDVARTAKHPWIHLLLRFRRLVNVVEALGSDASQSASLSVGLGVDVGGHREVLLFLLGDHRSLEHVVGPV